MDWIVCGWYTPDYREHWDKLRASLDAIGAPHDFVEVEKERGGWERNTMRKPAEVRLAMRHHPRKTVIFLDVDCVVCGSLADLQGLADCAGDIAVHLSARWNTNLSRKMTRFGFRSGTMVLKPNILARRFATLWECETYGAPRLAVDQDALTVALGDGGVAVTLLPARYCARPKDNVDNPVILHDAASREFKSGVLMTMARRLAWI